MWCANCNQEVPAIAAKRSASDVDGSYVSGNQGTGNNVAGNDIVCARCGGRLSASGIAHKNVRVDTAHGHTTATQSTAPKTNEEPSNQGVISSFDAELGLDDFTESELWDDQELMQAKIAVNSYRMVEMNDNSVIQRSPFNRDGTPPEIRRQDTPNLSQSNASDHQPAKKQNRFWRILPWATVCLGIMLVAFGGALASWSAMTGRRELFELGMLPCLIGQGILTVGLIVQLERLWRVHRQTMRHLTQLQNVTRQLSRESVVRDQISSL